MAIVSLTLNDKEKMWLEQIILDEDKHEALRFLKECIYDKVKAQDQSHCKPPF
ncbi:MAG: hypothetical protein ACE5IT_01110 [bacterium]